jgi:hypothetical protein
LRDFSLRVDQALPLSTIPRYSTKGNGMKVTKHNKRLMRMQEQWREEDKRRKDKREAEDEDDEEKREEEGMLWEGVRGNAGSGVKKGKKGGGGNEDGDDDPWWGLERKRREEIQARESEKRESGAGGAVGGVPGLTAGSSAQEPPRLMLDTKKLKGMFKNGPSH